MEIRIEAGEAQLTGDLVVPRDSGGIVVFSHGSGSSRHSRRNRAVAAALQRAGLATLLFDLLTAEEDDIDRLTRRLRFDIPLLGARLVHVVDWVSKRTDLARRRLGLFGASTGAAAALIAAAARPERVAAVVSRGGRPDLAGESLARVKAPTLLLVGGEDRVVIELNRMAAERLSAPHRRELVAGATHLFEEPGALEQVSRRATEWFVEHLSPVRRATAPWASPS